MMIRFFARSRKNILREVLLWMLAIVIALPTVYFTLPVKPAYAANSSAFLNGTATTVGTTETNIGSLATTMPATGDNLIIAIVTFSNTSATITNIAAATLKLKRGATILASNQFRIQLGGGSVGSGTVFPQDSETLLFKEAGATAGASPTYDVTAAAATGALIVAQTKMIVLNVASSTSSFQDGASVAIGTAQTTLLAHTATGVPAGANNIIIAAIQLSNAGTTSAPLISAGNLKLKNPAGTVVESNDFQTGMTRTARPKSDAGYLYIFKDTTSEAANPVYTVTATESTATSPSGEVKIIVISGLTSDFVDGASTALGTTETTLATLTTTLAAGENVVLASFQIDNTASTASTIAAGNERLYGNGAIQAQNANLYSPGTSTNTEDREFYSSEAWREPTAAANAVYSARDFANQTGVNGAARILAIHVADAATGSTFTQSNYRFSNNADSTTPGTALAANNTNVTLGSTGAAFRLRELITVATANLALSGQSFKLQWATQSGTCDTAFTGETYADVTTTTAISYNDNPTPVDGANITASAANDPTSVNTIIPETYEELNNFTNSQTAINIGQDGLWDFSLKDNGADPGTAYCLRIVKSTGAVLDTYSVIPQVTTFGPDTSRVMRHGNWFDAQTEQSYFWAR